MSKRKKSIPLPKDVELLYPDIKKYRYYNEDNILLAAYDRDTTTSAWRDTIAIEYANTELEKIKTTLQSILEKLQ